MLVAEVRRTPRASTTSSAAACVTDEALDVGEDFVGRLRRRHWARWCWSGRYGDLVVRRPTSQHLRLPPTRPSAWAHSRTSRRATAPARCIVGEDPASSTTAPSFGSRPAHVHHRRSRSPNTVFNGGVPRLRHRGLGGGHRSGVIYKVTGSAQRLQVVSPTTRKTCSPSTALRAWPSPRGADGTVLRYDRRNAWSRGQPTAFPMAGRPIETPQAAQSARAASLAVTGSSSELRPRQPACGPQLACEGRASCSLVVRGPQEVYGAFVTGGSSHRPLPLRWRRLGTQSPPGDRGARRGCAIRRHGWYGVGLSASIVEAR